MIIVQINEGNVSAKLQIQELLGNMFQTESSFRLFMKKLRVYCDVSEAAVQTAELFAAG